MEKAERQITDHREAIVEAEKEIQDLKDSMKASSVGHSDTEAVRKKLETFRNIESSMK